MAGKKKTTPAKKTEAEKTPAKKYRALGSRKDKSGKVVVRRGAELSEEEASEIYVDIKSALASGVLVDLDVEAKAIEEGSE